MFLCVHGKVNGQGDAGPDGVYVGCSTQKPRCDLGSVDETGSGLVVEIQEDLMGCRCTLSFGLECCCVNIYLRVFHLLFG